MEPRNHFLVEFELRTHVLLGVARFWWDFTTFQYGVVTMPLGCIARFTACVMGLPRDLALRTSLFPVRLVDGPNPLVVSRLFVDFAIFMNGVARKLLVTTFAHLMRGDCAVSLVDHMSWVFHKILSV